MARYVSQTFVKLEPDLNAAEYRSSYKPGELAPFSGIYRCVHCGREAVSLERTHPPPQNNHMHESAALPIEWRLLVKASHEPFK